MYNNISHFSFFFLFLFALIEATRDPTIDTRSNERGKGNRGGLHPSSFFTFNENKSVLCN